MKPLRSLLDWQDAVKAARNVPDHSLAKLVPARRRVRRSTRGALRSLLTTTSCGRSPSQCPKSESASAAEAGYSSAQSEDHQIQVFVNSSLRPPLCLQLHPSTPISALKGVLQDRLGIAAKKLHLFTSTHVELREPLTLEDHGIEQDTNIELRPASGLIGGTSKRKSSGKRRKSGKMSQSREEPKPEDVATSNSQESSGESSVDQASTSSAAVARRRRSKKKGSVEAHTLEEACRACALPGKVQRDSGEEDRHEQPPISSAAGAVAAQSRASNHARRLEGSRGVDVELQTQEEASGASALPDKVQQNSEKGDTPQGAPTSSDVIIAAGQPYAERRKKRRCRRKSRSQLHHIDENALDEQADTKDNEPYATSAASAGTRRKDHSQVPPNRKNISDEQVDAKDNEPHTASAASAGARRKHRSHVPPKTRNIPDEQVDAKDNEPHTAPAEGGGARRKHRSQVPPNTKNTPEEQADSKEYKELNTTSEASAGARPRPPSQVPPSTKNVRDEQVDSKEHNDSHTMSAASTGARGKPCLRVPPITNVPDEQVDFKEHKDPSTFSVARTGARRKTPSQVPPNTKNVPDEQVDSKEHKDPHTISAASTGARGKPCFQVPPITKNVPDEQVDSKEHKDPHTISAASTGATGRKNTPDEQVDSKEHKDPHTISAASTGTTGRKNAPDEQVDAKEQEAAHSTSVASAQPDSVQDVPSELHPSQQSSSVSALPVSLDVGGCHHPIFLGPASGNVFIVGPGSADTASSLLQQVTQQPSFTSAPSTSGCLQPVSVHLNITGSQNPTFLGEATGNTFAFGQRGKISGTAGDLNTPVDYQKNVRNIRPEEGVRRKNLDASPAQDAADRCEGVLKTRYITIGSYLQMIPWVDDDTMHIMDIYTQLQLVSEDGQQRKKVVYEDIFLIETREGYLVNQIICNGFPGLGKSTLIVKIAYDWAVGSTVALRKYKLVFVLKMHALEQNSDLIEALFDQLIDQKTVRKEDLSAFINTHPRQVLILLDGFDEFMTTTLRPSSFGSVLNILNRKECAECCVLVTTRPSHFAKLTSKSLIQKPFTHVRVLGFGAEDIEKYVSKFYSNDPPKAQELFEKIQSSDVLFDLAKSPMLLLLMCLLWREKSTLPDTMSRLYIEALMSYTFKRKGVSPEEASKVVVEIGKIALRGLVSPVQLLSFREREFGDKDLLDTAIRVGLLTSQRVLKGLETHNSIQFVHKTFQEFCASIYCQSLLKADTEEFQKILNQMANPLIFDYFLRFCCGDNEACTSMILQMLQKNQLDDRVLKLSLNCYFESQSKSLPSADFISSVVSRSICLKHFNCDDLNSFMWFLRRVIDDQEGGLGNALFAKVQEMKLLSCNMQRCSKGLASFISRMTNLSSLHLKWCWLSDNNLKHITSALSNLANVSQLGLSYNKGLVLSVLSGVPGLHDKKHPYQKLDASCNTLTADVKPVALPTSTAFTLVDLDLSGSNTLSGLGGKWAQLKSLKHLKELKLDDCKLNIQDFIHVATQVGHMGSLVRCGIDKAFRMRPSGTGVRLTMKFYPFRGTDVADILKGVGNRADLVELFLNRIDGLSSSAAVWAPHLKQLKHLERLLLQDCALQSTDIEHISVSLSDVPSLVELDLSQNKSLCSSGSSWDHLQNLKQLKKLKLDSCSFSPEDFRYLAALIGSLGNLVYCCIDNTFWVSPISTGIKVVLTSCQLSAINVREILQAISNRTDLAELVLSGIEGLGGSSASWAPHIKQLKYLRRLELNQCSLQSNDIEHIAGSLCGMPTLVELDLSKNESLCNSGAMWAHLQCMTSLKKLRLVACDLSTQDLKCLAASVGCMEKLVQCSVDDAFRVISTDKGIKLDLGHSPFSDVDLADIVKAVNERIDLVELILSSIDKLGGATAPWFRHLTQLKHLARLELHRCCLQSTDIEHVASSLSLMPTLVELNLSTNESLRNSGESWSHLQSLKQLKKLKVNSCNLSIQDLKCLAALIGSMGNLVYFSCALGHATFQINPTHSGIRLTINSCPFSGTDMADILKAICNRCDIVGLTVCYIKELGGSTALWTPQLQYLKNLEQLKLKHCSLQSTDIEHIAVSVGDLLTLRELDLCGNQSLGGTAEFWISALRTLKHLQKLGLSKSAITSEDMKHLVTVPNLLELNLSWNGTLSGSSLSWSPLLQQLTQLQTLHLNVCLLTDEDKKHIAQSQTNMISLVKLNMRPHSSKE